MVLPLFAFSAASAVLSFASEARAAKDHNEYLIAVRKAEEANAASQAAADLDATTSRALQVRKAAAVRLDELKRMTRKGVASATAAASAAGASGSDLSDEFKARMSDKLAADAQNLYAEEDQIQRMIDNIPIHQQNAVKAVEGASGPSALGAAVGILGSYFEIDAKYGGPG